MNNNNTTTPETTTNETSAQKAARIWREMIADQAGINGREKDRARQYAETHGAKDREEFARYYDNRAHHSGLAATEQADNAAQRNYYRTNANAQRACAQILRDYTPTDDDLETTTTPAPEIIIFRQNQDAENKRAKYQFAHVATVPATDEEENSLDWTDAASVKALKEIAREAGKHLFNLGNFSRIESTPEPTPDPTDEHAARAEYNDALDAWHALDASATPEQVNAAHEHLNAKAEALNSIEGTPEHAQAQAHATLLQKLKEREEDKASAVNQAPENVRAAFFVVMRGTATKYSHARAAECALYNKAREMFVYRGGVATQWAPRSRPTTCVESIEAHQNKRDREAHEQAAKLCAHTVEEFARVLRGEMPENWAMLREITGRKQAARTVENWMNNPTPAPNEDDATTTEKNEIEMNQITHANATASHLTTSQWPAQPAQPAPVFESEGDGGDDALPGTPTEAAQLHKDAAILAGTHCLGQTPRVMDAAKIIHEFDVYKGRHFQVQGPNGEYLLTQSTNGTFSPAHFKTETAARNFADKATRVYDRLAKDNPAPQAQPEAITQGVIPNRPTTPDNSQDEALIFKAAREIIKTAKQHNRMTSSISQELALEGIYARPARCVWNGGQTIVMSAIDAAIDVIEIKKTYKDNARLVFISEQERQEEEARFESIAKYGMRPCFDIPEPHNHCTEEGEPIPNSATKPEEPQIETPEQSQPRGTFAAMDKKARIVAHVRRKEAEEAEGFARDLQTATTCTAGPRAEDDEARAAFFIVMEGPKPAQTSYAEQIYRSVYDLRRQAYTNPQEIAQQSQEIAQGISYAPIDYYSPDRDRHEEHLQKIKKESITKRASAARHAQELNRQFAAAMAGEMPHNWERLSQTRGRKKYAAQFEKHAKTAREAPEPATPAATTPYTATETTGETETTQIPMNNTQIIRDFIAEKRKIIQPELQAGNNDSYDFSDFLDELKTLLDEAETSANTPSITPHWKDISSFSRGEKDRTPTTWEFNVASHRLRVHRHIHSPGKWLLSGQPFFDQFELDSSEAEAAKAEAINRWRTELAEKLEAFEQLDADFEFDYTTDPDEMTPEEIASRTIR